MALSFELFIREKILKRILEGEKDLFPLPKCSLYLPSIVIIIFILSLFYYLYLKQQINI